jgi:hypothetical protein
MNSAGEHSRDLALAWQRIGSVVFIKILGAASDETFSNRGIRSPSNVALGAV